MMRGVVKSYVMLNLPVDDKNEEGTGRKKMLLDLGSSFILS